MFDSAQLTPHSLLLDLPQSDATDSGASTPSLWHPSPPSSPLRSSNAYRTLSPASRTQAILRGQRELMDMVRNMPESSYELSLKDLVNFPPPRIDVDNRFTESYRRRGSGYGNRMVGQQQEGLLLKMVFPVPTGVATARGRRQRKGRSEESSSAAEKEWWRKRDGDSESGDSLYSSSTVGGSGKSSGSSSGSSRSNSANSNSNSIVTVR